MCTIPETLTINLSRDTAWSFEDNIELHKTGEGGATIFEQGDTHGTNGNDDDERDDVCTNRIDVENNPPGSQGGTITPKPETIDNKEPGNTEQLEFKPGRKPKEEIEGDVIRFLYSNDDSIYWLQGRLNSRIDNLETAVKSG